MTQLEAVGLAVVKSQMVGFTDQLNGNFQRVLKNFGRDSLVLACNDSSGLGGESVVAGFEAQIATLVKLFPKPTSVVPPTPVSK